MDLLAVREGIAANLSTINGLKVFAYEPDSIEPPSAIVGWPQAWAFHKNFHNALEGMEDLEIHILVGRAVDRPSQELLAKYLTSGRAALNLRCARVRQDAERRVRRFGRVSGGWVRVVHDEQYRVFGLQVSYPGLRRLKWPPRSFSLTRSYSQAATT
jgi:hypothetical protein